MKNFFTASLSFFLLLFGLQAFSQNEKFTLSGTISDSTNGETLVGAVIYVEETKSVVQANEYGFYSISLPKGTYTVKLTYLGYKEYTQTVNLNSNQTLDIKLSEEVVETKTVELSAKRSDKNVEDTKMSTIEVDIKQIKKLPALFGEVDILKNIQMLPGIQVAGEGNTGLYVRGGGADQNLILLDEAPVYNAAHLFGVFSVFNSDALKSAEIYKGGIPAQYGGRLSSLLDIRTKDGNKQKFGLTGGVGTVASRLTVEGPIIKDKCSFIASGRRTYADLFLKLSPNEDLRKNKLYFYDLNAKINYTLGPKDKIYLAGYFGRDVLEVAGFGIDWGNATGTFRWNHVYGEKLFSNTTLVFSNFDYGLGVLSGPTGFRWLSNLKEYSVKQDYSLFLNPKNQLSFGWIASYRTFSPGRLKPKGDASVFKPLEMDQYHSLDEAVYLSNKQKISTRLSLEYGLRFNAFHNIGKGVVYTYANGVLEDDAVIDSTNYKSFEFIKTYTGFEPRISGRFLINERSSIKASYNRTLQFLHLLSNTASPLPTATWIPSTNYIKPQKADQIAAGYFRNFLEDKFEASVESYYKYFHNVVDFKDNADIIANNNIETEIRRGKGWSYGVELFLRKNKGKFTGWVSYTWSKTQFQIPGVNEGRTYYASYDRRHNLNIVANYDINDRWSLSGNWIFGTGRPLTLPTQRYQIDQSYPGYIPGRNNYRVKDYHRLDLSATLHAKKKEGRKWEGSWNFSIYNVYARQNPFTVFTRDKNVGTKDVPAYNGSKEVVMIYLFSVIPAVTYNFKF